MLQTRVCNKKREREKKGDDLYCLVDLLKQPSRKNLDSHGDILTLSEIKISTQKIRKRKLRENQVKKK